MFTIEQVKHIIVKKDGIEFLTVKRKFGWGVTSRFYKQERLILESWLFVPLLRQIVKIKFQDLPEKISMSNEGGLYYTLFYNNTDLSMELRYFRKPPFILYKNGFESAYISSLNPITFGGRAFKMETNFDDDELNTLLLILFLTQLRGFS